ncbi:MAG: type III pantothenate kinase [Bacteroidaceae bacterium]|nr:type III pantothenate kinase [Bacteroidaceae bacterium]
MSCKLLVDIGNSGAKYSFANGEEIEDPERVASGEALTSLCEAAKRRGADKAIICSVAGKPTDLIRLLKSLRIKVVLLDKDTPLPFTIAYKTPKTFGADRVAAVAGAMAQWPGENLLVVDAGSCVTYEACAADTYIGGNIAPGLRMRLRAMHERTALLPEVEPDGELPLFGNSTATALRCGALRGIQYEIEGCARAMEQQCGKPRVILTGGDAPLISKTLDIEAIVDRSLVLRGLNHILQYNEDKI